MIEGEESWRGERKSDEIGREQSSRGEKSIQGRKVGERRGEV